MLMQVRTADINGELRDRLRADFRKAHPPVPLAFRSKPLLRHAAGYDPTEVTALLAVGPNLSALLKLDGALAPTANAIGGSATLRYAF